MFADVNLQSWRPNDDPVIWLLAFVIATIGNSDLLANIKSHHQTQQRFLASLVAANTLSILCLPVHYFHQLCGGCGMGLLMRMAFWISRDLAAAVQIFSVVVLSAVRFQNVRLRDNYVSLPTSALADHSTKTSAVRNIPTADRFTRDVPLFTIWAAALCYSVPAAVSSNTLCYIHSDDVFEDTNTISAAITLSVASRLVPLFCAIFLHLLTELHRRDAACRIQTVDDNGKLLSWLLATVFINYVPIHCWIIHSWSQHRLLTRAVADAAMYFPLYSTASCIPVVAYFTTATHRLGVIQTV
jgi:hypothetical protein